MKNDNPHSIRLFDSIRELISIDAAVAFEKSHPLSKSADADKKFAWAKSVCRYLDEHYDTETVKALRKECRCNDGKSIVNKLLKYLKKADSLEQFVELFNASESFASLEYISPTRIHFCYPECYCSCIKRAPGAVSKAWCYCTLGNAEKIFQEVFHKQVKVDLIESIKTGGNRCVIAVEW